MPLLSSTADKEIPVVIVHNGPSQVTVTVCVAQAKAAGCKQIFVISDRLGPWALLPGVHHFAFNHADRFGAREFRAVFANYSAYADDYALVIFERFFAVRALMAMHSLERVLHLDSDVLLYCPSKKLASLFGGDFTGSDSEFDARESVGPHFLLLTRQVCDRICSEMQSLYGSPEGRQRLEKLWERKKSINPEWGVSDMDILAFVRDCGDFQFTRANEGNPRVDLSIQVPEGFVNANGTKTIAFENGKPYAVLEATGERVFFHALHMQGYVKHLLIHYTQIHWLAKKILYALWKLEMRGWLPWPKASAPLAR